MGLFDRLDELTEIENRFENEYRRTGVQTPRGRREASPATRQRADRLWSDHERVHEERGREIGRLLKDGHTVDELRTHVNRTDRYR